MNARQRDTVVFVAYVGGIYATLSVVRTIQRFLEGFLGRTGFGSILTLLLVAAGVWFLLRVWRRLEGLVPRLIVAAAVIAYGYLFASLDVVVERVHFLEYGVLGYLGYRVLHHRRSDVTVFAASLLLCAVVGLGDEVIQWVLPRRVGEIRDVWINVAASLLGLVLLVVVRPPEARARPRRMTLASLGPWVASFIVGSGLFLRYVHGFGHLIADNQAGSFRSVFSREELLEPSPWKGEALRQVGGEFPDERPHGPVSVLRRKLFERKVKTSTPVAYLYEAYGHLTARDGLASEKAMRWKEAYSEHLILRQYYSTYYELQEGAAWTEQEERKIARLAAAEWKWDSSQGSAPYRSKVQQLLITSFAETTMWGALAPFALLLLIAPTAARRRGRRVAETTGREG